MSALLQAAGGTIFIVLGLLHAVYTLLDARRPRRLAPVDATVTAAMQHTGVRLARGSATTMWRAWIGFNLSHGLGAMVFGALAAQGSLGASAVAIAALYAAIGWRCWFWIPNTGIAMALLCFAVATAI